MSLDGKIEFIRRKMEAVEVVSQQAFIEHPVYLGDGNGIWLIPRSRVGQGVQIEAKAAQERR